MAKWKKTVIGSVVKGKDGKPNYIKVNEDFVLKKGMFLNLENDTEQLAGLAEAEAAGRLPKDVADNIRENIKKAPWYKSRKDKEGNILEEKGFILSNIISIKKTDD